MLRYIYLWTVPCLLDCSRSGLRLNEYAAISKYIKTKADAILLLQSIVYLLDVLLDWITIETEYKHEENAPDFLVPLARTFAAIGTIMYLLDAVDGAQWVVLRRSRVSPLIITLANLVLEDLPQVGIAIYAALKFDTTLNAVWGLNFATSVFGILTRSAHCFGAENEFTVPGLITLASKIPSTFEFLVDEDLEIDVPKLYDLYLQMKRHEMAYRKKNDEEYVCEVVTDMPGGVHLVMECMVFSGLSSVVFKEGSYIDLPQIASVGHFLRLPRYREWNLDFRDCQIGTTRSDSCSSISRTDYGCARGLCLVTLLNYFGLPQVNEVRIWPRKTKHVWLQLGILPFDINTIKGLCKVLATDDAVEHVEIVSFSGFEHIFFNSDNKEGETLRKMIEAAVKDNKNTRLKYLVWKKTDTLSRFARNKTLLFHFEANTQPPSVAGSEIYV